MKPKDFVEQLRKMMLMHIGLVESNTKLLQIDLELMKEVDELKKKNDKLEWTPTSSWIEK